MIIKALVLLMMVAILVALLSGGIFLVQDQAKTNRTLTSLKWRIGLSVTLFILLFIGFAFGIIKPHPLIY